MPDIPDRRIEAFHAAVDHLQACEAALAEQLKGGDPDWPEGMMAPYDGCEDCQVREVLHVGWPYALAEVRDELGLPKPPRH